MSTGPRKKIIYDFEENLHKITINCQNNSMKLKIYSLLYLELNHKTKVYVIIAGL
jgi:hypothetical protein